MTACVNARLLQRSIAPAIEPVSLAEVKIYLRITHAHEDAILADMIKAARLIAEEQTGKSLITQGWNITYDGAPPQRVFLPYGPIQSISNVVVYLDDASSHIIAPTHYTLSARKELVFYQIPSGQRVEIDYVAGYGDAAEDVPASLRQALLLHIAYLYEHRDRLSPPLAAQNHCYLPRGAAMRRKHSSGAPHHDLGLIHAMLRHPITLQARIRTADGAGGSEVAWQDVDHVWGALQSLGRGSEKAENGKLQAQHRYEMWMRYKDGISADMRAIIDGTPYAITSVEDVDAKGILLRVQLMAGGAAQ
jgi:uncharacterized phiE125 gp8 family phage protein/SPP1 family predicted phage head-tail adaptor